MSQNVGDDERSCERKLVANEINPTTELATSAISTRKNKSSLTSQTVTTYVRNAKDQPIATCLCPLSAITAWAIAKAIM